MPFASLTRSFWNLLAPLDCAVCKQLLPEQAKMSICEGCRLLIEPPGPRCRFCAAPLESMHSVDRCHHCRDEPFRFERIVALGRYDGKLMQAVSRMKAPTGDRLARVLGDLLAERCRQVLGDDLPQFVVPAPMVWGHRLMRGMNSPDVLAVRIARSLQLTTLPAALQWQRVPQRQSSLAPTSRRKNVRGALAASASYDFTNCHVLFVDDVVTTAATAREATRALRQAGAQRVTVATAARGLGE
jgi:ComF family protein